MRALAGLLVVATLGGCYANDSNLSASGKGRPEVTVDFPARAAPSSTQTATFTITNPGPGDMSSLLVTFTLVGGPRTTRGIARPIVGFGSGGENPAVVGVDPEPIGVSDDGVVYQFEGLEVGESTTVSFELLMPDDAGSAANGVTVSDGQELDRAGGLRLEITIEE